MRSISPPVPPAEPVDGGAAGAAPPKTPPLVGRDAGGTEDPQTPPLVGMVADGTEDPWTTPTGTGAGVTEDSATRAVSRPRRRVPGMLPPLVLGLVLLGVWQFVVQAGLVSEFLLPAPADVLRSFWGSLSDGSLWSYINTTLIESLAGCTLGALVALPLGYGIARSRLIASTVQPYLAASQALPAIAIAPLIALWLGYGLEPVIALCALIVFFPMVITTVLGLRSLDRDVLDSARVEGAGRWALLRHIEVPLALPSILAGVRTSITLSITGAVVGEFVVGGNGLGELLLIDRSYADSTGVFATLLMLALLAAVLYGGVWLVERRFSYLEVA